MSNEDNCYANFGNFISTCKRILDQHAPQKKKIKIKRDIGANQSPFMNRTLSKAIMLISKFRNTFLKTSTEEKKLIQNKDIFVLNFAKKSENIWNLDEKTEINNKIFWKVPKLL